MSSFNNKTAIVTGGNSGIGYASAKHLIENGAKVIITGRSKEATEKAARELGATAIVADQNSLASIEVLAAQVKEQFGTIDVLFLNAGQASFANIEDATEAHYDSIIDVNVKGVYFTIQKLLPLVNAGGSIVINTSVNANRGVGSASVYSASKGALLSLNRVLAAELAPRNIRINAISPGPVVTPIYGKLGLEQEQLDGFSQMLADKILLKRFGQPEEIAKAFAFLASDDASFITGTELVADGGLTVGI
jgi:NAD(P)-dependent dehydrogenase (short-subunit alcohol dehydrogenase family)